MLVCELGLQLVQEGIELLLALVWVDEVGSADVGAVVAVLDTHAGDHDTAVAIGTLQTLCGRDGGCLEVVFTT